MYPIQDLNTFPVPQEPAQPQEDLGLDDNLSLFINTEFFDFDLGTSLPGVSEAPLLDDFDPHTEERAQNGDASIAAYGQAPPQEQQQGQNMHFNFTCDFSFPDGGLSHPSFQNHQPNPHPVQHQNATSTSSHISASTRQFNGTVPESTRSFSIEDGTRLAAEEDKRRRNTAASARFRIKKKQREQQLEKTVKEMTTKAASLEERVAQLELENKWLKGLLLTQKHDGKPTSESTEPTTSDSTTAFGLEATNKATNASGL